MLTSLKDISESNKYPINNNRSMEMRRKKKIPFESFKSQQHNYLGQNVLHWRELNKRFCSNSKHFYELSQSYIYQILSINDLKESEMYEAFWLKFCSESSVFLLHECVRYLYEIANNNDLKERGSIYTKCLERTKFPARTESCWTSSA